MAKKQKKKVITKTKLKKLFIKNKIRECGVNLVRMNPIHDVWYRQALFRKYHIRKCAVTLTRVAESQQALVPNDQPIRSQVIWLPAQSATHKNSAAALSALTTYREKNAVAPRINRKNVIDQRTKSIFAEQPCVSNETSKPTLQDLHSELVAKCERPNRGLKPCAERPFSGLKTSESKQLTDCQRIRNEFEKRLAAKKAAAAIPKPPPPPKINERKLSWIELKLLTAKKYPVVECEDPSHGKMTAAKCLCLSLMYL